MNIHGEYTIAITGLVEGFSSFGNDANKITSAEFDSDGDLKYVAGLFLLCSNLTSFIALNDNWCKNITNMSFLFNSCTSLTTLNESGWNVGKATNMIGMFFNCSSLVCLNLNEWDVSKVTTLHGMFNDCSSLMNLNINEWDVGNVTSLYYTFYNCSSLTELDVSN